MVKRLIAFATTVHLLLAPATASAFIIIIPKPDVVALCAHGCQEIIGVCVCEVQAR
jgi:hypothetical protein